MVNVFPVPAEASKKNFPETEAVGEKISKELISVLLTILIYKERKKLREHVIREF
ncbi:Uncharacterised protein [Chlamydia trachomatis]|nr:Uncharacterised protein [Chlamydia trachomatis]